MIKLGTKNLMGVSILGKDQAFINETLRRNFSVAFIFFARKPDIHLRSTLDFKLADIMRTVSYENLIFSLISDNGKQLPLVKTTVINLFKRPSFTQIS